MQNMLGDKLTVNIKGSGGLSRMNASMRGSSNMNALSLAEDGQKALAEQKIQEEISKGSLKLVLENFKLQDISFLGGLVWENLQEIVLHKNYLSSIDILNQFRNLKVIKASDNYIQEINLSLQKLEDLDLHNNFINKFPLLHQLPRITRLNLHANKIADFRVEIKPPSCLSLQYLDVSNNQIDFASSYDFYDFLEKFKKFKYLKGLVITNNPFAEEKRFDEIVSQIPSLEMFNFERADEYRKQVLEEEKKKEPSSKKDKKKATKGKSKVDKATFYFPSLEVLCYNLEAANSHPSFALDHLKDLAFDVDKISQHLEMVDEYFCKGKDEVEINEMIETFMQNSQLLIDNHYELQNIMLQILSKLSIVKFYDFGVGCFNTLKDLMIAGKDMEERVIEVLKKEVVNKLQQQNPEIIPASLLVGLYELVKLTEKAEMLTGLYQNCFPSWLRIFVEKINNCKRIATICENNEHFDSIIALMAVSVKNCRLNVKKAIEKDLLGYVADILNESTLEQNRYIPCLEIVQHISTHSSIAANKFIDKFVHNNLIKNIRKNNDLKDEGSKDTEDKLKKKYLTLAAEIDCLGGLLEADLAKREAIIKDQIIDEMLQITSHYKTDPVLLTSICKFAKQLFTREEIKSNQVVIEPKLKKMQNLVQLLPYLGLKKYEDLLKMSRRYYDQSSFADKEKATQLQHLDNLVVQNLFIAVINLVNFFCEEAQKIQSVPIFEEVSQSLNDANRETALFNCLEVPNDDVKLAVVECLNNVSLNEFDNEEIATIIRLLSSCKNIGAGQTEYVIAKIFWILTKLTKDKESESGKNFRMKFGEKAITEALEILIKNLQRPVLDQEDEAQKLALSLSCVHFLKFTSLNPDIKRYMLNRHEQFKQALYAEENFTSHAMMKYPIEIEDTWLGRNMDVLIYALTGTDSIEPYNYVSFRVLQRMGDILMDRIDLDVIDTFQAGVDVIEKLKTNYREKLKARKRLERTYWEDPSPDFLSKLQQSTDQFNIFFQQHYLFTSNNGIPLMRMFLTKKVPAFEEYLKKKFNSSYDKSKLKIKQRLLQKKENSEFKELEKQRIEEAKKHTVLKKDHNDSMEENDQGLNILRMALQQEDLGDHYDPVKINDHLVQQVSKKGKNVENIKKRDFKVGVQNLKMRSLCISAYLRCLFAAIEYAPNLDLKQEAIRNLKDEFVFRNITQLCETTGWFEANIGAKYLRLMRHIITVPFTEASEDIKHLALYEIISLVIRNILGQLMIKIKNEQQTPLSNGDKVLIFELSSTCALICDQCSLFGWSNMEVKQQGQHCRTRRTPQEKVIDLHVSLLFPSQNIQTFIAIIFRDMDQAYKVFDTEDKQKQGAKEVETPFIKLKNELAREKIKYFLGDYLSKCKDNKYDILESLMKGAVFDKQKLRESFLQEILKSLQDASYKNAIQQYMFDKKLSFNVDEKEKINYIDWVEACSEGQSSFKPKLLVFTDKGVHCFRGSGSKPCSVCPIENLCPDGPRPEYKFRYDRITEIITFPNIPQKLVLVFQLNTGIIKKDQQISLSLIIPSMTSSFNIRSYLQEILPNQVPREDLLALGSIRQKLGMQGQLKIACYISYNPNKSIFSLWGENNIIPSCLLLVMSHTEFLLLRENWSKWYLFDEREKIEQMVVYNGEHEDQDRLAMHSYSQKQADNKLKGALHGIFTLVIKRQLSSITNLHVHKGKDPVLELQFDNKVEKVIFQCDFARQKFIETLLEIKAEKSNASPERNTLNDNNDNYYE